MTSYSRIDVSTMFSDAWNKVLDIYIIFSNAPVSASICHQQYCVHYPKQYCVFLTTISRRCFFLFFTNYSFSSAATLKPCFCVWRQYNVCMWRLWRVRVYYVIGRNVIALSRKLATSAYSLVALRFTSCQSTVWCDHTHRSSVAMLREWCSCDLEFKHRVLTVGVCTWLPKLIEKKIEYTLFMRYTCWIFWMPYFAILEWFRQQQGIRLMLYVAEWVSCWEEANS